jgi:hypothetical protein
MSKGIARVEFIDHIPFIEHFNLASSDNVEVL